MRRQKRHAGYFALPCLLLVAASCSSEITVTENEGPVELQITPSVALTRSAVNDASGMDKVAVYATGADYTDAKNNNYAVYTNKTSSWDNEGSSHIYLTNAEATVYAYYPTEIQYTAGSLTIPVTLLPTADIAAASDATTIATATGEKDYMYATSVKADNTSAKKEVTLTMNHVLSMVSFRVLKDATYKGPGSLTKIIVKDVNTGGSTLSTGTSPTMKITDGTLTQGAAQDATYERNITGGGYTLTAVEGTSKKFGMLVLPITSSIGADNIEATFTVDNANYSVKLPAPTDNSGQWKAGSNQLYTITLKGTELSVTVNVTPWTDVTGGAMDIQ